MKEGRDLWWNALMAEASDDCPQAKLDAEHPLFLLYTSGTTGKPKGILQTTGGYLTQVTVTAKFCFDLKEDDTYWCTADLGWVTGHSYVIYGILSNGATSVVAVRTKRQRRRADMGGVPVISPPSARK